MSVTEFGKILEQKSNGRIKIQVFPGGQLGDKKTQIQSLQTGALDMFMTRPNVLVDYNISKMKVLPLPYIFRDLEHGRAVLDSEIGNELLSSIAEADVKMVGVGFYLESPRNFFFTDKKVTKISDMKGLKLRVPKNSMNIDMVKAFGASPTPTAYSELYSALQTGVVDGAENPVSGYYANKFYEISKNYTLDGHDNSPNVIIMSEITWNKLSDGDKKLIIDSFNESKGYFRKLSEQKDKEAYDNLKKNGVEVLEVADPQEWRDAVKPIYEKYGAEYKDLIKKIQDFK